MQTHLSELVRNSADGQEADQILRSCVHCGFCTATCPTYQILGDELDSPRGRIYLIKEMMEGAEITSNTSTHLDRCLTCRACETTCPSNVNYSHLLGIAKKMITDKKVRPRHQRLIYWLIATVFSNKKIVGPMIQLGQFFSPILPHTLKQHLPKSSGTYTWPTPKHRRKVLSLSGCVQGVARSSIDSAAAHVLDALGISLLPISKTGCCGAVHHHLGFQDKALEQMRRNIDAWWPEVKAGAEAIVISSSACAKEVKEYAHALKHDDEYQEKATTISTMVKDISEILEQEDLSPFIRKRNQSIAFHPPCTLEHGQQLRGKVEAVLTQVGYTLLPFTNSDRCCGSAGTYSLLQSELSSTLLEQKVSDLESAAPELIATANIGCLLHIERGSNIPIKHWVELL